MSSIPILHRSFVNHRICEALDVLSASNFSLPQFAYWNPSDWRKAGPDWNAAREARLGWDVTDFGFGDFYHTGRVLFTLRNGRPSAKDKPYAEKVILGRHGQRAPRHYHRQKVEDIINRGGGEVVLQLSLSEECAENPVIFRDGQAHILTAPKEFRLHPGESLCIPPGVTHQFWGEETEKGKIPLIGEVSSICDDVNDNVFFEEVSRFIKIVEDEAARFSLCHEHPAAEEIDRLAAA